MNPERVGGCRFPNLLPPFFYIMFLMWYKKYIEYKQKERRKMQTQTARPQYLIRNQQKPPTPGQVWEVPDGKNFYERLLVLEEVDPDSFRVMILSRGREKYFAAKYDVLLQDENLLNIKWVAHTHLVFVVPRKTLHRLYGHINGEIFDFISRIDRHKNPKIPPSGCVFGPGVDALLEKEYDTWQLYTRRALFALM